jgi:pimeloyl-ACP methyl ester carboxylesterase
MTGDPAVTPFRIHVPDDVLDDLRRRLRATRWPEPATAPGWAQGVPLDYLREVCRYWRDEYDWRAREEALNRFAQFITPIDGLDIHFLHVRSPSPGALPLVITHGWPGSVAEFHKVIGPLSDPAAHGGEPADAFHVVCPTLPGFGFSAKPAQPGWGVERIAAAWSELMGRLGYDRFGAQGGDWGAMVTTKLGEMAGGVVGIHLNMPLAPPEPEDLHDPGDAARAAIAARRHYDDVESGYSKQQSTRPQTLGYALTDSPAGQAAWILEKFWSWTDCDGHPEDVLTRDELLDNVMLYWTTASAASSARLYWESFRKVEFGRVTVPTGIAAFPREIIKTTREWAGRRYHVTRWTDMPRGGHFAALEQPGLFVEDVRAFFRELR